MRSPRRLWVQSSRRRAQDRARGSPSAPSARSAPSAPAQPQARSPLHFLLLWAQRVQSQVMPLVKARGGAIRALLGALVLALLVARSRSLSATSKPVRHGHVAAQAMGGEPGSATPISARGTLVGQRQERTQSQGSKDAHKADIKKLLASLTSDLSGSQASEGTSSAQSNRSASTLLEGIQSILSRKAPAVSTSSPAVGAPAPARRYLQEGNSPLGETLKSVDLEELDLGLFPQAGDIGPGDERVPVLGCRYRP